MPSGYYRFPTLHDDTVVFVCEDDLWHVPASGGIPRRLTASLGEVTRPQLSPDGAQLAFVGKEEGQAEIYCMPALGGPARRLTYLGSSRCMTAGWTPDGRIIFASSAGNWYPGFTELYTVDPADDAEGFPPERLAYGPARFISFGPGGAAVIGRNTDDPARWKRYRGGTAGQLWVDREGNGDFKPLIPLQGNLASPMWIWQPDSAAGLPLAAPGRIYFISDHEGVGNLYSCLPTGEDLRRHTDHTDYYVRHPSTDGRRIVYHAGADLYLFDPATEENRQIPVEFHSPQTQRNRKFVKAERFLENWELHPQGQAAAITARGSLFTFANWEGAVIHHRLGEPEAGPGDENQSHPATAVRLRLPSWLPDGDRLVAVTDAGGEEAFVLLHADASQPMEILNGLDIGRPEAIAVSPRRDQIVFSNHRYEFCFLDLDSRELRVIDRGMASMVEKGLTRPISGFCWSPDGEWVAYSVSQSLQINQLKLWRLETGEITPLTEPVLRDIAPAFDPQGKYLYFLSYRSFDPVYDNLHFDLNFPRGMKPYLITLQKDTPSPFIPQPKRSEKNGPAPGPAPEDGEQPQEESGEAQKPTGEEKAPDRIQIDLEGIQSRLAVFPVPDGLYGRILGTKDGKALYSRYPVESALEKNGPSGEPSATGTLYVYNFEDQKEEALVSGITDFSVTADGAMLMYRAGNRLRVLKAGEKPDDRGSSTPSRKSGWLDLNRVKVPVLPGAEWRQMFREAWRLQRDQFWTPDMSQVDWLAIHDRYLPLVDRLSSRSEFSDLMWEMQGELGTSHAYEFGGDYRPGPYYGLGFLGAETRYDDQSGSWEITHLVQGDPGDVRADSPLRSPGINVKPGDRIVAINGQRLDRRLSPAACLVNLAGEEVTLTIAPRDAGADANGSLAARTVTVKTLRSEAPARYREWVENNRRFVHNATGGRIGYLHIPDMVAWGYAEFHRGYLAEVDREGLIVDVRFNQGGHVSSLLLEKLARRRLGYDLTRWSQVPVPYPLESVAGPLVALTNEFAGSDGDIFCHGFKLLKLGPLIGKRTWGGVIGIEPRHFLVDGTTTTQPEFSFWFQDVGWNVENYGTDPDIEVDIRPQDYARGQDVQLERAIDEILKLLEASPPPLTDFDSRPSRAAPKLPDR